MTDKSEDKIYEDFGIRLRELRRSKGKTQKELSLDMNLSQTAIAQYESGTRRLPLSVLRKFSNYFGLTLDELIDGKEVDNTTDNRENSIENSFGSKVRELRKERNLSRLEVSKELDISVEDLDKFEAGSKSLPVNVILRFASFYNVNANELLGLDISTNDNNSSSAIVSTDPEVIRLMEEWTSEIGYFIFNKEQHAKLISYAKFLKYEQEGKLDKL